MSHGEASSERVIEPRTVLFVMWQGGGNVPVQLGIARRLVLRGHRVRVLADPAVEAEARESGCEFSVFRALLSFPWGMNGGDRCSAPSPA
jgi:hypothetical protein